MKRLILLLFVILSTSNFAYLNKSAYLSLPRSFSYYPERGGIRCLIDLKNGDYREGCCVASKEKANVSFKDTSYCSKDQMIKDLRIRRDDLPGPIINLENKFFDHISQKSKIKCGENGLCRKGAIEYMNTYFLREQKGESFLIKDFKERGYRSVIQYIYDSKYLISHNKRKILIRIINWLKKEKSSVELRSSDSQSNSHFSTKGLIIHDFESFLERMSSP